jgi:hypothetical protein
LEVVLSDLRLIGSEDGFVLFESLDGTKHRAIADDALKSALRKAVAQDTSSYVSPRDIQERIRNGETVSQICEDTASPEDYVAKFAKPVIDELEHMIESARAVRLVVPGDRFNDEGQIEFGELISSRLDQANAVDVAWTVRRSGATTWDVSVSYRIGENSGLANWAFDPRKVLLTPENEAASGLSTVEGASGPITKVRVIADTPAAFRRIEATEPTIAKASKVEQVESEPVASIESLDDLRKKREAAKAVAEATDEKSGQEPDIVEQSDELVIENDQPLESASEPDFEDPSVVSVDEVSSAEQEIENTQVPQPIVDDELAQDTQPMVDEKVEEEPATSSVDQSAEPNAEQPTKKPRAAMPSWDQIVFGTKSED